ncbi:MAG TPA: Xaa-Pro peptidase family protein [Alphaproteobacteria bacterium]|nr:Xaa-Pro peptidase family protein [Alphaproteobacteria bacterium]
MSKHDFPLEEFKARQSRTRQAIAKAGLDWLLVIHPVSLHWLIGAETKSYQAFQCLPLAAEEKPLVMFTRESERYEFEDDTLADEVRGWGGSEPEDPIEAFERLAADLGLGRARIGLEVPAYYLHPHHYLRLKSMLGAALVAEPSNLVPELKMVKSPRELALVREASRIADHAMEACVKGFREGRSELEVAGDIYHALMTSGSGLPASTINLVSGERLRFSHGAPTLRKIRRGDCGNVEFGAAYKRYTTTIGRQFSLGAPSPRLKEVYDIVRRAGEAMIAEIRAGVPAIVPHEAAKRVIAQAGLDRYRIHTSGYGIAPGVPPAWGEPINMFGGSRDTLQAGMVVSVEPPVFIGEEKLGARIIDNVVVTATGAERLSRWPRDLIVLD